MPRNNLLGQLRRSQAVMMYGPGAIVDFRGSDNRGAAVSVVVAGLEQWDAYAPPAGMLNEQTTFEPRLQRVLNVHGFRLPPVNADPAWQEDVLGKALVGVRFPQWLQCPSCHRVRRTWSSAPGDPTRWCQWCSSDKRRYVVPVRFVVACQRGHLDEFPWDAWVGHRSDCLNQNDPATGELILKFEPGQAGLAGLVLRCQKCGARRSMAGCFAEDALHLPCRGRRPWLPVDPEPCDETPRALQRGASNVYFPSTLSALSIPPWSDDIAMKLGVYWEDAVHNQSIGQLETFVTSNRLPEKLGLRGADICQRIAEYLRRLDDTSPATLRWEEYQQLLDPSKPAVGEAPGEFEARRENVPPDIAAWVSAIARVTRLREVRALRSFTRINPPGSEEVDTIYTAKISAQRMNWLPAIEIRGEGIFLALDRARLSQWESLASVREGAAELDAAYQRAWAQRHPGGEPAPRRISARFVLLHSVAHLLLRQLALDCGYSAASIRERIYAGDGNADMAGLLLYTGTTDSEGTLGGLQRQGRPARLVDVLSRAIRGAKWCSSDPLCVSGLHAVSESLNKSACHACILVPETSCEEFNRLLDRSMVVGKPRAVGYGFFEDFARDTP